MHSINFKKSLTKQKSFSSIFHFNCFRFTFFILLLLGLFSSCKRYTTYEVTGIVINKVTGEPIEGATVTLQDGIATYDAILSSEGPSSRDEFVTGADGIYRVKIKTKSNHAVLGADKSGFEFKVISEGGGSSSGWKFIPSGESNFVLELQGLAYFNSPFQKTSSLPMENDSLLISILSYEAMEETLYSWTPSTFKGKGPFNYFSEDSDVPALGDRFLRYKLEWKTDGVWYNKIDSVFLPTSSEVYKTPIYY